MTRRRYLCSSKADLSEQQRQMVHRIENYDLSLVMDKLVRDGRIPRSKRALLEREFKRFVALVGFKIYPLAMISPLLDEVWHQFILFTDQYRKFCSETVGAFISHQPDTPSTPVPVIAGENFRSAYARYFGPLPKIWFDGMSETTKRYYLQPKLVGAPPTTWSGWTGPQ